MIVLTKLMIKPTAENWQTSFCNMPQDRLTMKQSSNGSRLGSTEAKPPPTAALVGDDDPSVSFDGRGGEKSRCGY